MKITHKFLDNMIADAETFEQEGRDQFNDVSLPYEQRQEGLLKIKTAKQMLIKVGEKRTELNNKSK